MLRKYVLKTRINNFTYSTPINLIKHRTNLIKPRTNLIKQRTNLIKQN